MAALLIAPLVFVVRSLSFEWVFVGDDVLFSAADTQYHLRRAFAVFEHFPRILLFDPYINYPGGAPVPWPPLFDWTVGAVARLFASDQHGFEVAAAWLNPVFGTLVAWPIALVARRAGGPTAGRAPAVAIAIYALIPIVSGYSRIGIVDHHVAVALIGAWLMWCCVALVDPDASPAARRRLVAIHVAVRCALLLTWHGSLLYLALAEATLALAFAFTGRRRIVVDQALGALATAFLLVPILAWMPEPLGGAYSSIALSRLHLIAMLAVAAVAGGAAVLADRPFVDTPARRLFSMVVLAALICLGVMIAPGPRDGLRLAYQFLSMTDAMGQVTAEQTPLFAFFGREPVRSATRAWGWLGYLIPLTPFAAWWCARRAPAGTPTRAAAWVVVLWAGVFGLLAMSQRRYANDFGPAASVAFALGFVMIGDAVARKLRAPGPRGLVASALAAALVLGATWPSLVHFFGPRVRNSWVTLRGDPSVRAAAHAGVTGVLTRFLANVRAATPETAGYFAEQCEPEYGVIAHANLGHAIQYLARRPTATDPFWSYIGPENWDHSARFFAATDEAAALAAASALRGRYVITQPQAIAGSVARQLHAADGNALAGRPALSQFRLVEQAPGGAASLWDAFAAEGAPPPRGRKRAKIPPYKLFEIVPGAVIAAPGLPGERASASVEVRVLGERLFIYRREADVGVDGLARLRVPYATELGSSAGEGATRVRTREPYRVRSGAREWLVSVPEDAVLDGAEVPVIR